MSENKPNLLSVTEAAACLGIDRQALYHRIRRGLRPIPVTRGSGRNANQFTFESVQDAIDNPEVSVRQPRKSTSKPTYDSTYDKVNILATCPTCSKTYSYIGIKGSSKYKTCTQCKAKNRERNSDDFD